MVDKKVKLWFSFLPVFWSDCTCTAMIPPAPDQSPPHMTSLGLIPSFCTQSYHIAHTEKVSVHFASWVGILYTKRRTLLIFEAWPPYSVTCLIQILSGAAKNRSPDIINNIPALTGGSPDLQWRWTTLHPASSTRCRLSHSLAHIYKSRNNRKVFIQ